MHLKYLHYFGNESNESLLDAYGIIDKGIQLDQLKVENMTQATVNQLSEKVFRLIQEVEELKRAEIK